MLEHCNCHQSKQRKSYLTANIAKFSFLSSLPYSEPLHLLILMNYAKFPKIDAYEYTEEKECIDVAIGYSHVNSRQQIQPTHD